jgi:putative transposase
MLRGIKVRLYPTQEQIVELNKVLGCYRFVYNHLLSLKQEVYNNDKTNLGLNELSKYLHGTLYKQEEYYWLNEQNTKVLQQALRQMLTAYNNFFKQGKGFPKFKSKKDKQSALFPLEAISKNNKFTERKITLTKSFKDLKFRCSDLYFKRLQTYKDSIKSATLSKTKSGNFFLSILIDLPHEEVIKFKQTNDIVGIDLGVKDFVITSDGEVFENKHFYKSQEKKIKKLHKQLSKKVKGSNNREKSRIKLAKAYERLTNKKEQYLHNVVNMLLSQYDIICMEDLNVRGMLKNHKLSKAIQELGFYRFKSILEDKSYNNGKRVVFVDRFYPSSKRCSCCGYIHKGLTLRDREWVCPECGEHHDRDINASINILMEGERIIGIRDAEYTLVESPTVDDRNKCFLKSSDSVKQEEEYGKSC